jgi:hypothetical protein
MRRLVFAACVFFAFAFAAAAEAGDATDLLYFDGELVSGRDYAGLGWLHAFSGLDDSGVVFALETGKSQWRQTFTAAQAGWRFAGPGLAATFLAGAASEPRLRPLVSADLWFEPTSHWMTRARFEAANWTSWSLATGWRPDESWPWIGPEIATAAGLPRAGLHLTGVRLLDGIEARLSSGVAWNENGRAGSYGEISFWRRF